MKSLRVLSLGLGMQSTTLALMSLHGQETPIHAAVFADTHWEPREVYAHLGWLRGEFECAGVPLYVVSAGDLRAAALAHNDAAQMPVHVRKVDGGRGMIQRQCTRNYKLRPIRRQVRALLNERGLRHAEQVIGISLDEFSRMRDSDVKYITNVYPLVERRMTRWDCQRWLERHGFPIPHKSACLGCPFRSDVEWAALKGDAASWGNVVDFDAALRDGRTKMGSAGMAGHLYLHSSLRPLSMVDLSTPEERGQMSFLDECQGMCGV